MNRSGITVAMMSLAAYRAICNGCGARGGPFGWARPPQLCYQPACDQHDVDYWVGGRHRDKRVADAQLWATCRRLLVEWQAQKPRGRVGVWLRWLVAAALHAAVVIGGYFSFHWGKPRTVADLALVGVAEVIA